MMSEESPYLLVLNAAEGLLQVVLARQDNTSEGALPVQLCAQEWHAPSQGAELLAPALQDAFTRLGITAKDIGRIASVRGPGSFTGVRLTIATAAGLARATGALQAGLEYLPLLAKGAAQCLCALLPASATPKNPAQDKTVTGNYLPRTIWVITHARRNLVHMQGFTAQAHPAPLTEILVCSPDEAVNIITRHAGQPVLLGSGFTRNRAAFELAFAEPLTAPADAVSSAITAPLYLPASFDAPTPAILLEEAAACTYGKEDIPPLYARPCDAEENLDRIAVTLRLDPVEARRKLAELTGEAESKAAL